MHWAPPSPFRPPPRGFTLIELVTTMIVIGILAVVVLPRMDVLGSFDARGYGDQMEAWLRHAQKSALAQRRQVRVELAAGTATAPVLCLAAAHDDPCPTACGGMTPLTPPPGRFRAAKGGSITGTGSFCFDTNGRPSATQTITVRDDRGEVARTITVEAETGYVH